MVGESQERAIIRRADYALCVLFAGFTAVNRLLICSKLFSINSLRLQCVNLSVKCTIPDARFQFGQRGEISKAVIRLTRSHFSTKIFSEPEW